MCFPNENHIANEKMVIELSYDSSNLSFAWYFFKHHFCIFRTKEISDDSAWETILENEESHQEVINNKPFFYSF